MSGSPENGYFYEVLAKTRSIVLSGEVNQKMAEKTIQQLLFLQELSEDPIKVFINSQGGHVESGDTIYDMFKFVKPRIIVIGTGWV
ncbi:MAG TPA: ATP-dependent Clp protease proteolytic subunit, partial [Bacillota bacterium]|nr:ATP-dependent Clp protease proteolytic subunit [Bacillota bacterium]